jgi:ATP-dependent helicase/nuclease subunit B
MKGKNNIFNIEANYHFFESFLLFLEKKFPEDFDNLQILLPNRRSCREFKQLLLQKTSAGVIPQIKAISDISYEDFFQFLPQDAARQAIDELSDIKTLDDLSYLFFLSEKIQNQTIFGELNFEQSFKVAIALKELFDEIEREEIDLTKLIEIDDSNLAKHRQITLQFLTEFSIHVKNLLLKENILSPSAYQNLVISRFTECLKNHRLKSPLIIAGSTGSVGFSKKLIQEISEHEKGFVVLNNFKKEKSPKENHPQFLLNRLAESLKCQEVEDISNSKFTLSCNDRQELISLMMLPFEEVIKWQNVKSETIAKDLEENFLLIEAKNNIEEAKVIAQILQKNIGKKAAVIINDEDFINLLKLELERLNIEFNDSRSQKIFNSKLINFLTLILELIEGDFNSHALLSLFKHPLCKIDSKIIAEFEINILRKSRCEKGLKGLQKSLKNNDLLEGFFNEFLAKIPQNLTSESLIKIAENLSEKTWLNLIAHEEAGEEIFTIFEKLKQQDYQIKTVNDLKVILSQISYFSKTDAISKIQILSPIEARLLNFDLVIVTSLNEGIFPQVGSENWLGKKIKKDLGIDKALQKIGQNAHDFCCYLSNTKIILSRSQNRSGTALIESPFLIKFKTIAQKFGAEINRGKEFFKIISDENNVANLVVNVASPKPALDLRPNRFSITEISKLQTNPYFIYCKKILKLRELDKIDYEAGHAEFGSFVHEALEEFIKDPKSVNFAEIFDRCFIAEDAKLTWWPKFEKIFANFLEQNAQFADCKNLVEEVVEARIGNILLRGKVDRIIIDGDDAGIFDYKTGTIPEAKKLVSGLEPQLTIAALILIEEQLKSYDISSLNYWKLSSSSEGGIKKLFKDKEEIKILTAATKQGLEKLFSYFENEESGYLATGNLAFDEYQHLARIDE